MPYRGALFLLAGICAGTGLANETVLSLMNQGDTYRKQGRNIEAAGAFDRAIVIARAGQSPLGLPEVLSRVGSFYVEAGHSAHARDLLTEAIARFETLSPMPLGEAAYAWNALGMARLNLGSAKQAEENLRQAVALSTQAFGEEHEETAGYQVTLALALMVQGQYERADLLLGHARQTMERKLGETHVALGVVYAELSASAAARNKLAIAEEYGEKALEIYSRQTKPDTKSVALAELNVADVYVRRNRLEDAARIVPDAVEKERVAAPDSRLLADGIRKLAELRSRQHSWQEARDLYREAIHFYERTLGPNDPALRPVLLAYLEVLKHNAGSKQEVRALEARARTINTQPRT